MHFEQHVHRVVNHVLENLAGEHGFEMPVGIRIGVFLGIEQIDEAAEDLLPLNGDVIFRRCGPGGRSKRRALRGIRARTCSAGVICMYAPISRTRPEDRGERDQV